MTSKRKPIQKWSFSEGFFIVASLFLLSLLLYSPSVACEAVLRALKQCASLLIPSLFPLMVASEIAMESGALERITKPFQKIVARILGVKKEAAAPYFLGLLGGYTTSVGGALSLYKNGKISKRDCERIIAFSSIPSLSFLTGFVGAGIFNNSTVGWILWGISVLSTLILGLLTQIKTKRERSCKEEIMEITTPNELFMEMAKKSPSPSKIIVGAISHSANAMVLICACVVFFSSLISALQYPLSTIDMPLEVQNIILGSFEITNGITNCTIFPTTDIRIALCAFFIGWSGFSVHFQIISICDGYDLSFKKYLLFKIAQGLLCAIFSKIIFLFL